MLNEKDETGGMKKQIAFLSNELKKMQEFVKSQEKLKSEVENLKICLSKMELSIIFGQSFQIQEFNQLNGELQTKIISDFANKSNDIHKIWELLAYISSENKKLDSQRFNSPYIYIPYDGIKENKSTNSLSKNELVKISLAADTTKMLFDNNSLTTDNFINLVKLFPEFEIEIKYPSLNFDEIFNTVLHLKNQKVGNIFISIFISEIEATDRKFKNNNVIDSVKFDSSVKIITGSNFCGSFQGCSSLKYVILSPSITSIGAYAFRECSSLKEIIIPSSVTDIGNFAFNRCSSLNVISIPSSVNEIGSCCFSECSSLTEIYIPSSVSKIGKSIVSKCSSLKNISIPSSEEPDVLLGIGSNVKITYL